MIGPNAFGKQMLRIMMRKSLAPSALRRKRKRQRARDRRNSPRIETARALVQLVTPNDGHDARKYCSAIRSNRLIDDQNKKQPRKTIHDLDYAADAYIDPARGNNPRCYAERLRADKHGDPLRNKSHRKRYPRAVEHARRRYRDRWSRCRTGASRRATTNWSGVALDGRIGESAPGA